LVLRKSPLFPSKRIEAVIGVLKIQIHKGEAPISGMLSKHYAPQTKTILSELKI
jgi:hypothetical protein